jgi:hypothetical protein
LPRLRVGHQHGVGERRFSELQIAAVGDVPGDALPRLPHAAGLVDDRVQLRRDEFADDGVDQALSSAESVVNGGFADAGGRRDLLHRRAQPAAVERLDGGRSDLSDVARRVG